jgi:hypothetical protein
MPSAKAYDIRPRGMCGPRPGHHSTMSLGTSIFLIAVGAIMRFAVHTSTSGFSIHTAGTILMIVGIVGLVLSLLWMTLWADRRRAVDPVDDGYAPRRRVVREREVL